MSGKMEPIGILFELQWKKKSEDVANIGIWDTPDSSLDWMTFKSYLCQNLGTMEDIHVAYVDSDGDELPIESECEFQEALKFARQRASKGKQVVLKVERNGIPLRGNQTAENIKKSCSFSKMMTDSEKNAKQKQCKISFKSPERTEVCTDKFRSVFSLRPQLTPLPRHLEEKFEIKKTVLCCNKSKLISGTGEDSSKKDDLKKKSKLEKEERPPVWFKKYMQKMKNEIIAEVTAAVTYNTTQMLEIVKAGNGNAGCCSCGGTKGETWSANKNRKKSSDEDSSDGNLSNDQRDHKLLKKIEKLHKREKKLEKKLDSKLEKLENKAKRRMEKKSQSKARNEPPSEKKQSNGSRKRSGDGPVGTYLMDAILLADGPKPTSEMHIKLGQKFTKVWDIMNNGTLPWTDKTELRLAWGTLGLEPEETVVKCPILEPGKKGQIAVNFRAPEIPGTFESYWHFYHMGDRFGHWLGFSVVVDPKEAEKTKRSATLMGDAPIATTISAVDAAAAAARESSENALTDKEKAVDLTVKSKPEEVLEAVHVQDKIDQTREVPNKVEEIKIDESNNNQKDPEYYSDSDDDNLSVISGTVSLSSNSEEEEENFVVVPLPACFKCDVPLESSGTPSNSEKQKTEKGSETYSNANQSSEESRRESYVDVEAMVTSTNVQELQSEQEADAEGYFSAHNDNAFAHSSPDTDFEGPPRADIYYVDKRGQCIPVEAKHQKHEQRNNENESCSSSHQENESRSNFSSWQTLFSSGSNTETFGTDRRNGNRFHFYTASSPPPQYNSSGPHFHHHHHHFTGSSAHSSCTSQNDKTSTTAENGSDTSPQDSMEQPAGASVHILPEGLVSGVIDVASHAYSTAKTVLNNLRPRPEVAENASCEDTWTRVPERSTSENLETLIEMGFTNKVLNVLLLERYQNDLAKVVSELLTYGKSGRGR